MKRIAFVPNPHVRLDQASASSYVPLELLSGMAVVEQAGAAPALFDVNRMVERGDLDVGPALWSQAALRLAATEPELVVLETWTGTLHHTLLLVRALRQVAPDVPLVLAGCATSTLARQVLERYPDVDGVLRGELEPGLGALATSGWTDGELPAAPGLARRVGRSMAVPARAFVEDFARLPSPAYHLAGLQPGDVIQVESGRGCDVGCSFCALAGHWPPLYRHHTPGRIAAEMLALKRRFPTSALDLSQDVRFFDDPGRVQGLCEALVDAERPPDWTCHARVDRLTPGLIALMARAGCRGILFGVETGCPALQERIGKRVDVSRIEDAIAACRRHGLEARASFIVGFPDEDRPALARTVAAMLRARRAGATDVAVSVLRAYPGSRIHHEHAAQLRFEPRLCPVPRCDVEARDLIRADPGLLSSNHLVPGRLSRGLVLGAWLGLSRFINLVDDLLHHGATVEDVLDACTLDGSAGDDDEDDDGTAAVARRLAGLSAGLPGIDPFVIRDRLAYELAIIAVQRQIIDGNASAPAAVDAPLDWTHVRPVAAVPWQDVVLHTELDHLIEGDLRPPPARRDAYHALVARVPAAGPAFYTRRSFVVETFVLDDVGAALLPLCTGKLDTDGIVARLSAQLDRPAAALQPAVWSALDELARSGVVTAAG